MSVKYVIMSRRENKMAGYNGWSMSNNAVMAYKDGEKPLSKWTKKDILDAIEKQAVNLQCSIEN